MKDLLKCSLVNKLWNRASTDTPKWKEFYLESKRRLGEDEKKHFKNQIKQTKKKKLDFKEKFKRIQLFIKHNQVYKSTKSTYPPPYHFPKPSFDPLVELSRFKFHSQHLRLDNLANYFSYYKLFFNPMWLRFYLSRDYPEYIVEHWK